MTLRNSPSPDRRLSADGSVADPNCAMKESLHYEPSSRQVFIVCIITILLVVAHLARAEGFSKLEAISLIETADKDGVVGQKGEVSRYQILPRVWRTYTASAAYQDPKVARRVAGRHVSQLEGYFLQKTGRPVSDFDLYVMWNAGPAYYARRGFSPDRVAPLIKERAQRFVNLREMNLNLQATSERVDFRRFFR
jgi:hypothetical protein